MLTQGEPDVRGARFLDRADIGLCWEETIELEIVNVNVDIGKLDGRTLVAGEVRARDLDGLQARLDGPGTRGVVRNGKYPAVRFRVWIEVTTPPFALEPSLAKMTWNPVLIVELIIGVGEGIDGIQQRFVHTLRTRIIES